MTAELLDDHDAIWALMCILETDYKDCWGCDETFDVIELSWATGLCPVCSCIVEEKKRE